MKIRNGFVSNSSSSSFICQICREDYEGDSLNEAEMIYCKNNHLFCKSHLLDVSIEKYYELTEKLYNYIIKNYKDEFPDYNEIILIENKEERDKKIVDLYLEMASWESEIDIDFCPICQLEVLPSPLEILSYLYKKYNLTEEKLLIEMRNDRDAEKIKEVLNEN